MNSVPSTAGARARLVLVVEDDIPTAELLASAINDEHGYEALCVESADAALEALTRVAPDLMLLDIRLPGMSGFELYDRVRADDRFKSLPVVFETGSSREHVAGLRGRGIATYIKKPFDIEQLVGFIKRLAPPHGQARAARARERS